MDSLEDISSRQCTSLHFNLIKSAVFDDLAHQVVHLCIQSLFTASTLLITKKSRLDADLFLIKHLLILKEQIGAFDIEYVRPETEISIPGLVERFKDFSFFSPSAIQKVVQLPVVVENMLDAKEELDGKLRIAINGFTKTCAEDVYSCLVGKSAIENSDDEVKAASEKFRENAEKLLPNIQSKTEEYIGDPRTTDILVNAVMVGFWIMKLMVGKRFGRVRKIFYRGRGESWKIGG